MQITDLFTNRARPFHHRAEQEQYHKVGARPFHHRDFIKIQPGQGIMRSRPTLPYRGIIAGRDGNILMPLRLLELISSILRPG